MSDEVAIKHWLDLQPSITGAIPENALLISTLEDDPASLQGRSQEAPRAPYFRRHGLGRTMMAAVERTAREELGLELVLLDTATALPARLFYLKTG